MLLQASKDEVFTACLPYLCPAYAYKRQAGLPTIILAGLPTIILVGLPTIFLVGLPTIFMVGLPTIFLVGNDEWVNQLAPRTLNFKL